MADLTDKQINFVSRAITICESLLETVDDLDDLRREWDELGYGSSFGTGAFVGDNAHLDLSNLAALAQAQGTIKSGFDSGIRATLLKFRR